MPASVQEGVGFMAGACAQSKVPSSHPCKGACGIAFCEFSHVHGSLRLLSCMALTYSGAVFRGKKQCCLMVAGAVEKPCHAACFSLRRTVGCCVCVSRVVVNY